MSGSVPAQEQTYEDLGGKKVSDLISSDTAIDYLGNVTGTLKYVDWTDFSSEPDEQKGNYFPVHIDDQYKGKDITCKGEKTKTANDLDWVLLVKGSKSTFTFECEGKTILTLNFAGATLAPAPISLTSRKRVVRKKEE